MIYIVVYITMVIYILYWKEKARYNQSIVSTYILNNSLFKFKFGKFSY